jgi:hypothetical protein
MGNKHIKKPGHDGGPDRNPKPAEHCKFEVPRIQAVRIEPSTEDRQWQTHQKENWRKQLNFSKWLNWITGVGAVAAIFYGGITYMQWQDAHYNFMVDQRAWIGVKNIDIRLDGNKLLANVVVSNTGKTPALDVRYTATIDTRHNAGNIEQFIREPHKVSSEGSSSILAPNAILIMPMSPSDILAADLIEDIKSGKKTVYLFGETTYLDYFRRSHTTRFCVFYIDNTMGPADCPKGNYVD